MEKLSNDWLTQGWIDFEYKKYLLLAYLKNVKSKFGEHKLYPQLSDLLFHYNNLKRTKENKRILFDQFPSEITSAELENLKINYKKLVEDDEIMKELEEIITYSIPLFKLALDEGKEIYESVEKELEISPVGISPIYNSEGYVLLNQANAKETLVYRYQLSIFTQANEKYRGVHTSYVDTFSRSISTTFENMKIQLVKRFKDLPNPATFLVKSKFVYPVEETLLPVTKRYLIRMI